MPVNIRDPIRVHTVFPSVFIPCFECCFGERAMSLEVVRCQLPCTCI